MHAIFVIHKTAFLHSNLNSSSAEILNLQLLSFFVLESLVYNNFTKDKSINCCNHLQQQGASASHDYYINESSVSQPTFQCDL